MKLEYIEIQTGDLENTVEFYQRNFNFPVIRKTLDSISFQIGSSTLKFVEKTNFNSMYHLAFNIPENKLEEVLNRSRNKLTLIPVKEDNFIANFEDWNAESIYFYDNNGNILEFIARHDLKNSQHVPFENKHILNISEIGIVKDNPLEFGQHLVNEYGLDYFIKNNNNKDFTALGDNEGLLIIVKNQRNWFPTRIPAKKNRTEISILHHNRMIKIKTEE